MSTNIFSLIMAFTYVKDLYEIIFEWICFSLQDAYETEFKAILLQLSLTFPPMEGATVNWEVLFKMSSHLMKSNQRHVCVWIIFIIYFYVFLFMLLCNLELGKSQLGICNGHFIWNLFIILLFDILFGSSLINLIKLIKC